jgi:hypothetical protein
MSNAELVAAYARDLASKYPEGETKALPPTQRMKDSTPSFKLNRFVATVVDAWETAGNTFQQGTGNFMNRLSSSLDRIDLNKRPRSPSPPTHNPEPPTSNSNRKAKRSPTKKQKLSPAKDSDHESLLFTDEDSGMLPMKMKLRLKMTTMLYENYAQKRTVSVSFLLN